VANEESAIRKPVAPIIAVAALAAFTVAVRLLFTNPTAEDALITLRYVRNILAGLGFVYNPGERVLGTTTPLLTMILVPFGAAGANVVIAAKLINIAAEGVSAVLIYALARQLMPPKWAFLPALAFALSPANAVWGASGMETGLYLMLILAAFYAYARQRYAAAGVVCGLLPIARPDGALVGAVLLCHMLLRRPPYGGPSLWRFLAAGLAVLVPWVVFSSLYFGSPVPNSLLAKSAFRGPSYMAWLGMLAQTLILRAGPAGFLVCAAFVTGVVVILYRRSTLAVPLYWLLAYILAFTLARAGVNYAWYPAPTVPIYLLVSVVGVYALAESRILRGSRSSAAAGPHPPVAAFAAWLTTLVVVAAVGSLLLYDRLQYLQTSLAPVEEQRTALGLWLRDNTPADAVVCLEPIGHVGWFSERYILDEAGLVSPQVIPYNRMIKGRNPPAILQAFEPDYYVAWSDWDMNRIRSDRQTALWFALTYNMLGAWDCGRHDLILWQHR
jgi:hypothetical protein